MLKNIVAFFIAVGSIFSGEQIGDKVSVVPTAPASVLFTGDIMLGRYVETLSQSSSPDYPFEKISPTLQEYDVVVGNLEGPIPVEHQPTPNFSTLFSFDSSITQTLLKNNISVVSLANNHTFDFGAEDFKNTQTKLEQAGITPVGHPGLIDDSFVQKLEVGKETVQLVGLHAVPNNFNNTKAQNLTAQLEKTSNSDFIVVMIHWGAEYQATSHISQKELAHRLIDSGADLIVGHHPHVVQELEVYKDKLIAYSLGNFVFDQYFSKETQEGLLLGMEFDDGKVTYKLLPISSQQSQPRLMDSQQSQAWLEELAAKSSPALLEQIAQGKIVFATMP